MRKIGQKSVELVKTGVLYLTSLVVTFIGVLLSSSGIYRLGHNLLESSLFYILAGGLLILTFNQEIRLRVILMMPTSVRKYLYEKSLVDLAVDLFATAQSLQWGLIASGVFRKEEIRRVTETLPEEYQFVNQRGLVNLLPESLQGALNPFYNIGESLFSDSDSDRNLAQANALRSRHLTVMDVPSLPPRPSEVGDQEEVAYPASRGAQFNFVRGVQIMSSEAGEGEENDQGDSGVGDGIFVIPGASSEATSASASSPSVVAATVLDANNTTNSRSSGDRHNGGTNSGRAGGLPHGVEGVIVDIITKRAKEMLAIGQRAAVDTASYVVTGGDMSDNTLLSAAISFGVVGSLLSGYDVSAPIAAAALGPGAEGRQGLGQQLRGGAGRVLLRHVLSPVNATLRALGPSLYLLSAASGGMYFARLLDRHSVLTLVQRQVLRPLLNTIDTSYQRCLAVYTRVTRHQLRWSRADADTGTWRAHVAALVTTLTVIIAWRLRQHWRRWRWLVAVIIARVQGRIAAQAASVSSYFR